MYNHNSSQNGARSVLQTFALIIVIVFVVDQLNMFVVDRKFDWHEGVFEAFWLAVICAPLLWFMAFRPLRNALLLQQEKAIQLEATTAEVRVVQAAFQASEEKYRGLFENSPIGIYQMTASGDILAANPAYANILRCPTLTAASESGHRGAYLSPGHHQALITRATECRDVVRHETQLRLQSGRVIWVSESLRPSYDGAGDLQFYDGTLQDITEQKLAEEADAASRKTLQAVIDNIPELIFWKDVNSTYLGCNRNFAGLVGLTKPEDVLGRSDKDLFPPEDAEAFRQADCRVMTADTPELRFAEKWSKNGVTHWTETSKIPMHDANGNVMGLLVAATDITERVQREEQLREREAALSRTNSMLLAQQEATLDGILIIDENRRIVSFNSRFCELWDIPVEIANTGNDQAALGFVADQLADWDGFLAKVEYLYAHPEELSQDEIALKDGRVFERSSVPVFAENGQYNGRVWYYRDITTRKRDEEDLRASREMLKSVIDNIPELIFWKDINSTYLGCNRNYANWVGLKDPSVIIGLSDSEIFSNPEYVALFRSQDLHVIEADASDLHITETWPTEDGQIWTETNKIPLHDAAGQVIGVLATAIEITERVRAEEVRLANEATLHRQNSLLVAQQEANLDGLLILDENQRIVSCNQRYHEMWGTSAEIAGPNDTSILMHRVAEQLQDPKAFVQKVKYMNTHPGQKHQDELFLRDGRVFERRSVPVTAQDGSNNGRVLQFRDVTERKKAEEDLRASQEMLRTVIENIPQSVFWKDTLSVIVGCNQNFALEHGCASWEEMVGKTVYDLRPASEAARLYAQEQQVMSSDSAEYHQIMPVALPDGSPGWIEVSKIPLHDATGRVVGILGTLEDITERKRADEELRSARNMLQMIIDNIPQSIFWKDTSSAYLGCNETFAHVAGFEHPEDMIGKTDYELPWKPDETEWFRMIDRRVMDNDAPEYRIVEPQLRADGTETWLETNKIPLHDGTGNVVGILGTFEDITDRKRIEADLVLAKDQAEAASRAKSQFLANMSHELRTPMNAVIGFSEILQDQAFGPLNPRQAKYVGNILTSGRHLLQLINDILDITKIEAGRMTLEPAPMEISDVMESVQGVIKALSMKKQITFSVDIQERMPIIRADSGCLKQVLYNLFSNAIKFTPEGGEVRVGVQYTEGCLDVVVIDNGIGIALQDQARIWGEFEQVDSTYARTQQGTGLGLALTRRLVELHGGRIWVESEGVGRGSRFRFSIPVAAESIPEKTQALPLSVAPLTTDPEALGMDSRPWVLLVEDDPQAGELLTHCLEEAGYAVSRAGDGEQALFLAPFANPCAVLLDIEIPIKDGWEVLAELKADTRTQDIPVVVVSVTQDRTRALGLGASECFVKPIDRAALIETLHRVQTPRVASVSGSQGIQNV